MEQWACIYPSNPGIAGLAKSKLPCRLERLEELIGLEKGAQGQCIDNAEGKQERENP